MKKVIPWLTLVVVLSLTVQLHAENTKTRYLESNGFEKISALQKQPTGWKSTVIEKTKDFVEFSWDDVTSYQGERSLSIKISEDHPGEDKIAYNWYTDIQNWQPGHKYEYSCLVKGQDLKESALIEMISAGT